MTDLEKLEYIHHVLQECEFKHIRNDLLTRAIAYVEDLREPHLVSRHCKNSLTEVREEPELRNPMGELI